MDYNSIVRTIASALATRRGSNLRIVERSIISGLAEGPTNSHAGIPLWGSMPKWIGYGRCSMPATLYVVRWLNYFFYTLWVVIVYGIPALLRGAFIGKVDVHSMASNIRYNFFLFCGLMVTIIIGLTISLNFFITEILLFSQPTYSNSRGALVMEQPLLRTHNVYLFNTALLWSDTGIDIQKGDDVYITVSGGFFSDITEQVNNADSNKNSTKLVTMHSKDNSEGVSDAMKQARIMPHEPFGRLLCHIGPELLCVDSLIADTADIVALSAIAGKPIKLADNHGSGRLRFCVNDIYFTDIVIDSLLKDKDASDRLAKKGANDKNYLRKDRQIWFSDNNGELLINVIVDHNVEQRTDISATNRLFTKLLRPINTLVNPPVNGLSFRTIIAQHPSILCALVLLILLLTDLVASIILRRSRTPIPRS